MWPKTDAIGGPVLAARRGPDDPRDLLAHFFPPWYVQELKKKKKTLTGEKNGQAGRGCSKMSLKIEEKKSRGVHPLAGKHGPVLSSALRVLRTGTGDLA